MGRKEQDGVRNKAGHALGLALLTAAIAGFPATAQTASEDVGVGVSIEVAPTLSVTGLSDVNFLVTEAGIPKDTDVSASNIDDAVSHLCVETNARYLLLELDSANELGNSAPCNGCFPLIGPAPEPFGYTVVLRHSRDTVPLSATGFDFLFMDEALENTVCPEASYEYEVSYDLRFSSTSSVLQDFGLDDGQPYTFTDQLTYVFTPRF
ncbi:MAG: hypothetical protein QNI84_11445 [Henriciella sp.]|nr:hypothetical protein [Henriciella sp.]